MSAAAYLRTTRSISVTTPTMKSTRSCSQGQQQPARSPVTVSETSFFLTTIDTLYGMADEDDNQRAFNQMVWDEYFQQDFVDSEWQASQPALSVTQDLDPPSVPDFMDGRMAVTMHPPMPYRPYAPLSDEGIHSNDPLAQSASPSMQANTTYSMALAYQSDETTTYPWFEQLPGSPPNGEGSTYGYNTSTSTPMTVEVKSETPSTASLMEESASYFTQHISPQWEPLPIQLSSPSHSPGPERSSKAKIQRISPLGASQTSKSGHPKRAVACWRCRKYRKPVGRCLPFTKSRLIEAVRRRGSLHIMPSRQFSRLAACNRLQARQPRRLCACHHTA